MTASGDKAKAAATAATMSLFITLSPGCATSSGGAGTMTYATVRRRPESGHFPVKGFESVLEVGQVGQRHDADACGLQPVAHRLGDGDGGRAVAVYANRIDLAGDALARGRVDRLLIDHAPDIRDSLRRILDHRVGFLAWRQQAVVAVGAIGEHFLGHAQAHLARRLALLG